MTERQEESRSRSRKSTIPVQGGGRLAALRREINQLFDRFMRRERAGQGERGELVADDPRAPGDPFALLDGGIGWLEDFGRTDFSETAAGYEIEIDLPGLKREDVTIDYTDGILHVAGERTDEREEERKGYYLSERRHGLFQRRFGVPENVEVDGIRARFSDGVLHIELPKTEEAQRNTRRIAID